MAPGADLVALKIDFYTSSIVQAIDYAVSTDHVDVINESFGRQPDSGRRGPQRHLAVQRHGRRRRHHRHRLLR